MVMLAVAELSTGTPGRGELWGARGARFMHRT